MQVLIMQPSMLAIIKHSKVCQTFATESLSNIWQTRFSTADSKCLPNIEMSSTKVENMIAIELYYNIWQSVKQMH